MTDRRQTDHAIPSVTIGRIYLVQGDAAQIFSACSLASSVLIKIKMTMFSLFLGDGSPCAIGPLSVLSVCLIVSDVGVGYCGQTVGWIKMRRGIEVGLAPATLC